MKSPEHLGLFVVTFWVILFVPRIDSQRAKKNPPVNNWTYSDRASLTGNRGNFYHPIFGIYVNPNNNPGYPTNLNRSQPNLMPGPQSKGSNPRPVNKPYPWSFQPSAHNNGYTRMPQSISPPPSQTSGYNNGYTLRPSPAGQWSPQSPSQPATQRPTSWVDDQTPRDHNQEFDLEDFQSLPESYKTAFMSVEELVRNRGMVSPPGPNSGNVVVVFNQPNRELFDPSLQPIVSDILPTLVPGTWRSMTYVQGCCSSLRFFAANGTLTNIHGQQKKIAHFDKYNPPMYQFIPHGICASKDYLSNGHCLQGLVPMTLLVYDLTFNPPISFDIFSIPTYCNCVHY